MTAFDAAMKMALLSFNLLTVRRITQLVLNFRIDLMSDNLVDFEYHIYGLRFFFKSIKNPQFSIIHHPFFNRYTKLIFQLNLLKFLWLTCKSQAVIFSIFKFTVHLFDCHWWLCLKQKRNEFSWWNTYSLINKMNVNSNEAKNIGHWDEQLKMCHLNFAKSSNVKINGVSQLFSTADQIDNAIIYLQ